MKYLFLIFRILKITSGIIQFSHIRSTYHRKAKELINKVLGPAEQDPDTLLPSNARLKMQWYMAQTAYSCENMNRLTEQRSTDKEKEAYLLSGLLGSIYDMMIDETTIDDARIMLLKRPPTDLEGDNSAERMYLKSYRALFDAIDPSLEKRTRVYFESMFDAQLKSKKQFDQGISTEEADTICREKGGYAMLCLRGIIKGEISAIEEKLWYELGVFIQFCNDAQDIYKDLNNKLRTFGTVRPDLRSVADDLEKQRRLTFELIKKGSFAEEKKDEFILTLHLMYLGILAKMFVFSRICDQRFSHEKLRSFSKQEVRSQMRPMRLARYVFPRVILYKYADIEKKTNFELNF